MEPDVSQRRLWEPSARKLVSSALVFPLFRTISGSHSLLCLGHVLRIVSIVTVGGRGELRNNTESRPGEEMAKAVGRLFPWSGFSLSSLFCMPGRWVKIREEPLCTWGSPLLHCLSFSLCLSDVKFHVDQAISTLLCCSWRWPRRDDPVFPSARIPRLYACVTPYWEVNSGFKACQASTLPTKSHPYFLFCLF